MGVVDSIMVGRLSAEGLGAVALGNVYFFAVAVFGMGVLMALDPLVAQAVGAGDECADYGTDGESPGATWVAILHRTPLG